MKNDRNLDLALLLIRLALALVFFREGFAKLWEAGAAGAAFAAIGLPAFWAYVMAGIELVGAFLMLIGVATGWTGILLAIDMLAYAFLGGYAFDLALFLSAVALSLSGPGAYALEGFLAGERKGAQESKEKAALG